MNQTVQKIYSQENLQNQDGKLHLAGVGLGNIIEILHKEVECTEKKAAPPGIDPGTSGL